MGTISLSRQLPPGNRAPRLLGQQVNVGDSYQVSGDAEFKKHVETSLEKLTKQRLLEAENRAESILSQANHEAAAMLAEARAEIESMIREAHAETEAIRKEAYEEGYKDGFAAGEAEGTQKALNEAVAMIHGAETMVEAACQAERLVLKNFEKQALALVEQICKRVLAAELSQTPDMMLGLIERAIENLGMTGRVKVVMSAQALQDVQVYARENQEALESLKRLDISGDPLLDPGQVFVIGAEGSFDLSPASQVQELMAPLQKSLSLPREGLLPEADAPEGADTDDEDFGDGRPD